MTDRFWQHAILPIIIMDFEGKMVEVNHRFVDLIGHPPEALIGQHFEKVMDNGTKFFFNSMLYPRLMIEKEIQEVYLSLQTNKDESRHVMFNAQVIEAEQCIQCFIVPVAKRMEYTKEIRSINKTLEKTVQEKTRLHEELVDLNLELKSHAEKDWLTDLYNRRMFLKLFKQTYEDFEIKERMFSICILDVDHFKQVNDQYGHYIGDQVLAGLAGEMKQFFGSESISARFGGEEFILLLPDRDKDAAYEKADQFREQVKRQDWQGVSITISLGISMVTYPSTVNDMIVRADNALYKAKKEGRDRVVLEN